MDAPKAPEEVSESPAVIAEKTPFQEQISEYRASLGKLEQQTQSEYDKAVMTLSGGALGISFSFLDKLDKIVKPPLHHTGWLLWAWICWGSAIAAALYSYYSSILALRKATHQLDARSIYMGRPGGWLDRITGVLNASGGVLFVLGLILLVTFVFLNLS